MPANPIYSYIFGDRLPATEQIFSVGSVSVGSYKSAAVGVGVDDFLRFPVEVHSQQVTTSDGDADESAIQIDLVNVVAVGDQQNALVVCYFTRPSVSFQLVTILTFAEKGAFGVVTRLTAVFECTLINIFTSLAVVEQLVPFTWAVTERTGGQVDTVVSTSVTSALVQCAKPLLIFSTRAVVGTIAHLCNVLDGLGNQPEDRKI